MSPILKAYPKLELLRVRGSQGLAFKAAKHETLRALAIECGGLSKDVVGQICKAKLPNLEYLELWLGDSSYGGNAKVNDLLPILKGTAFPNSSISGCAIQRSRMTSRCDCQRTGAQATRDARSVVGTLSDAGGQALLKLPAKLKLKRLNLEHHFLTKPMMKELRSFPTRSTWPINASRMIGMTKCTDMYPSANESVCRLDMWTRASISWGYLNPACLERGIWLFIFGPSIFCQVGDQTKNQGQKDCSVHHD